LLASPGAFANSTEPAKKIQAILNGALDIMLGFFDISKKFTLSAFELLKNKTASKSR
jgi:hypothetical protein